jgi:hypothetical protein
MTDASQVVLKKLKVLRKRSPEVRAMFNFLTMYDSGATTSVEPVAVGASLTEKQVREVFSVLQRMRLGRLVLGRHKQPTRFEWSVESWKDMIPGKQRGEPDDEDEETLLASLRIPGAAFSQVNTWAIQLKARKKAVVTLPSGVEAADLAKLIQFFERYRRLLAA